MKEINVDKILKKYQYGSHVYGNSNEHSDRDYIFVVDRASTFKDSVRRSSADITVYSLPLFKRLIEDHKIDVLECIFQDSGDPFLKFFSLDKEKLRREISAVSSNSFVKCKKKLRDGEEYIGKKSMFHSIRILMFGIQIAESGRITDYACANKYYEKVMELDSWEEIVEYFQPVYNSLKTKFKILAPLRKDLND